MRAGRRAASTCVVVLVVLLVPAALARPSGALPAQPPAIDNAKFAAAVAKWESADAPGCAYGIVKDGRLIRMVGAGLANLEHSVQNTWQTNFDLGSTSKQFTAAVVALLANDGRLSLGDDVRKFIPELPQYGRPILLRDLMNHTSGLRDYTDLLSLAGHHEEDLTTSAEALAMIARQKGLNFPPGSAYRYCNSGYFLLSIVVQRATGKSLREVARSRLFAPLAMTGTTYMDDHVQIVPHRATGYKRIGPGQFATAMSDWEQVGDGGVQSSILDLERWVEMFDDQIPPVKTIPAEWLRRTLETPGKLDDGTELAYGLGLAFERHRGLRVVEHGGAWAGYRAMLMRIPEKRLATIVLCNVAEADTHQLAYALADAVLDATGPQGSVPPGSPGGSLATGRTAEQEAGLYYNEVLGEILTVGVKDGSVFVKEIDDEKPLRSKAPRVWVYDDPAGEQVLTFADDGGSVEVQDAGAVDPRPVVYRRAPRGFKLTADMLDGIEGAYRSDEIQATWTVNRTGAVAHVALPNGEGFDLQPIAEDLFTSDWGMVRLKRDGRMRPTALALTNRGVVDFTVTRLADDAACR